MQLSLTIDSPFENLPKNLALFPDRDLGFSTTLNLQKVLGFNIGNYDVTVSYADYTSSLNFVVNTEENSSVSESEKEIELDRSGGEV